MTDIGRRGFLKYVGAGASGALAGWSVLVTGGCRPALDKTPPEEVPQGIWALADGSPDWQPVPYPAPLPGPEGSTPDRQRLAEFEVRDRLVLPRGFAFSVLAQWGDEFGAEEHRVRFGYNNDYTGMAPVRGSADEFWLLVNHEYVSTRPWLESWSEVYGGDPPDIRLRLEEGLEDGRMSVNGWDFPGHRLDLDSPQGRSMPQEVRTVLEDVAEKILDAQGVSVLRLRAGSSGGLEVVTEAEDHKRISAFRAYNAPQAVFRFSGAAGSLMEGSPRGTLANCSGGTTPWGTFLTCEENFQQQSQEEITPRGGLAEHPRPYLKADAHKVDGEMQNSHRAPLSLKGLGRLLDEPLDGRHYGWVTEIEPETGNLTKHTCLGRFRHENVALRCLAGEPLAAYMGDDRRGGHVWKFVSRETVGDPSDPANSRLLEDGTLYVARFQDDYSGRWIPLRPTTPLVRPRPEDCPSGHMHLPDRPGGGTVKAGAQSSEEAEITVEQWVERIESFTGKPYQDCTLGDLAEGGNAQGVLLMDAFAMANCIGGTPSARPEDLEVHPLDHSVYVAFTDATEGSEGSPDQNIFPDSTEDNSRQYGALFRLAEGREGAEDAMSASEEFHWGIFVTSGEVAEQGGGFACADNLLFDPGSFLWMVTDISTSVQNFPTRRREESRTLPGHKYFPGIFGNNAMFFIPTRGPHAARPFCFATGPMECEMAGPTFTPDGRALVLSIQHPGEVRGKGDDQPHTRQIHLVRDRRGAAFQQIRTVPRGSHFPHGDRERPARPAVVCITRETESSS